MNKPATKDGYSSESARRVRDAALTLATHLGSFIDDLVIVGGLVPSLLVEQNNAEIEPHVGTLDLDVGLSVALLDDSRYVELVDQLKQSGFEPDLNSAGKQANHRWRHKLEQVTVDFLIAPSAEAVPDQRNRVIEKDLSAIMNRALPLAFRDRRLITVSGSTLGGEKASRDIWVCGPGAFVVMKALAFKGRGANKDAYDLLYFLQYFGSPFLEEIVAAIAPLRNDPATKEALHFLATDFTQPDHTGPVRAATFLSRTKDLVYRSDLAALATDLLSRVSRA